jgi:ABC-type uncharacterized transport system substrate-binding protein
MDGTVERNTAQGLPRSCPLGSRERHRPIESFGGSGPIVGFAPPSPEGGKSGRFRERVYREAQKNRADALIILASPFLYAHRTRRVELAAKHRLPTMYNQADWVVGSGGLMSYGPNLADMFRRAATYVDKILRGTKPADLPVEQPTKFELMINLKAAKQIGLTIPPNVLARADKVIR